MMISRICALALALAACSDANPGADMVQSSIVAGNSSAAGSGGGSAPVDPDDPDDRLMTIDLAPQDKAEEALWENAENFVISFDASSCFGSCPAYKYKVDQSGELHFEGSSYVARPGVYDTKLEQGWQDTLLFTMIRSGFLRLSDRYTSDADGCSIVTDMPTFVMRVELPDRAKEVHFYAGCFIKGPANVALHQIVAQMEDWIEGKGFVTPNPRDCRPRDDISEWRLERTLRASYVLFDSRDQPAGLLRMDALDEENFSPRRWHVQSCAGDELFGGTLNDYGCGSALLPRDSTFHWPGVARPINAAILRHQDTSLADTEVLEVRLLDASSELSVHAHAGEACEAVRAP